MRWYNRHMHKTLFMLGIVAVAVASFWGGALWRSQTPGTPPAPTPVGQTESGVVESVGPQGLVVRLFGGDGTRTYPITDRTSILEACPAQPKSSADLIPGSSVALVLQDGGVAMIQILATSTPNPGDTTR